LLTLLHKVENEDYELPIWFWGLGVVMGIKGLDKIMVALIYT
jgi:hypothetical protein